MGWGQRTSREETVKTKANSWKEAARESFTHSSNTEGMPRVPESRPILMELPVWKGR